ncbi:MAG TPA: autotransporter domain-containing protein, partial [Polyangia bacterium]|nr:autotransporter domain-containing protein [Polyangia bacterium]
VLAFDRSDDVSFDGEVTGSGKLLQMGAGTLTLTGGTAIGSTEVAAGTLALDAPLTSVFTVDAGGTLRGSTSTILTGDTITDNGVLVYDQASDGAFAGSIQGAGELAKEGSALLTLNGVSSVGSTVIDAGELRIGDAGSPGATLTSPTVQVNSGATLSGHGTIVGSVTNDGTVAPGGTIGVLTVNGDYTQTSNGTLSIEMNPNANSELVVTGTANLAGKAVLVAAQGNYRKGASYTFLKAGTINGQFASVTNTAGLDLGGPELLTGTAVIETGVFTNSLATANEGAIGLALVNVPLGASSDFDTIANAVLALPNDQQAKALDQLGGEIDADLPVMARDSARTFLGGIGDQLESQGATPNGANDPWGKAYGNFGKVSGDANAHGYDDTSGGLMIGASHEVGPNALVGAAVGYEHTSVDLKDLPQSGEMNVWSGALYGEARSGPLFFDAVGSLAYVSNSTKRHIDIAGVSREANGSFGGYTGGIMGKIGERVPVGMGLVLEPSVSLLYTHVHQDGFTEADGSGANLTVDSKSQDAVQSVLQAKLTKSFVVASGGVMRASVRGGWAHDFQSTYTDITQTFAVQGGEPFTLAGAYPGRNAGLFGVSLTYDASKRLSFFGRYDGSYGDRETNHAIAAGFSFTW